ncbi:hypothetical protein HU200_023615 [Digitaria exilis]|uniref:Uncharacterized protein n=1 Tax=Digitaria exilis TaxID=1010633 RepID=A0A835C4V8_9POAL|nr:hypothetical protein HU200_023615 [Digitaria exilis]
MISGLLVESYVPSFIHIKCKILKSSNVQWGRPTSGLILQCSVNLLFWGAKSFGDYQISFIRHDEGVNMKDLDLDRSVWLMLLCFPPDAKNLVSLVDKSLVSFGQLIHVHKSSTLSRLVVRVLVNKDSDVPDSVTLSVGTYPRVRTWTVPIYLLCANDVVLGGDEEPIPVDGPTHGLPHPAPGWLGPVGMQPGGNADEGASVAGGNVHVAADGYGAAEGNEAIGMEINDEMPIAADGHGAGANVVLVPEDNVSEPEDFTSLESAADFEASDHGGKEMV